MIIHLCMKKNERKSGRRKTFHCWIKEGLNEFEKRLKRGLKEAQKKPRGNSIKSGTNV